MAKNKTNHIFYLLGIALLYSFTSVLMKVASENSFLSSRYIFYMTMAFLAIGVYTLIWQQILKIMPLSTAFSTKGMVIVYGMIWGYLLFDEPIRLNMIIGVGIIIIGIFIMVKSDA